MTASLPLRLCALALLAVASTPAILSAQAQDGRVRLFHSDSIDVTSPTLSPDGRWLVFSRTDAPNQASLWIQQASGGTPRRLTSSGHYDDMVRWLGSGDGVVFRSTRPARAGDTSPYLMVLPIDARTGEATGAPRQISADPVGNALQPSPDGAWIAYRHGLEQTQVRIVPRAGGASRVLATLPNMVQVLSWSPDGRTLRLSTPLPGTGTRAIYSVAVEGGEARRLQTHEGAARLFSPDGRHAATFREGPGPRDRTIEIVTDAGDVVQRIHTNTSTRPVGFSRDGRSVLLLETNVVAPTRAMSIAGGKPRDLTSGNSYDWVMGFTDDGKGIFTWRQDDDSQLLAQVPLNGGRGQDYPETRTSLFAAATASHLLRVLRPDGAERHTLEAVSLRDGSTQAITDALDPAGPFLPGPGGSFARNDEIYFTLLNGDGAAVHAWKAPGASRLVRKFPGGPRPRGITVHGNRVAWEQPRGDSMDILVADGPAAVPRRLYTHARYSPNGNELAFSHDGRQLVLHTAGVDRQDLMLVLDVTGNAPPRVIDTGMTYWYWPRWMPDDTGIVVIGGGIGSDSHVVLVPLTNGAKPINITRDDPSPKWGFELSPDGKWIAYPGEIWKGSSVWKVDLKVK